MNIISKPCGNYQTNCYIVFFENIQIIIDPGQNSFSWIKDNVTNPIAILNTHGHFDHVWDNSKLQQYYNIDLYCPKDDIFMLKNDPFNQGTPVSIPNIEVEYVNNKKSFNIGNLEVIFHNFPGHTPGCSVITIQDNKQNIMFSGDFIFLNSIGRVDFPYSNSQDMKNSILRILQWEDDYLIYCGHGNSTTLNNERKNLKAWLDYI